MCVCVLLLYSSHMKFLQIDTSKTGEWYFAHSLIHLWCYVLLAGLLVFTWKAFKICDPCLQTEMGAIHSATGALSNLILWCV